MLVHSLLFQAYHKLLIVSGVGSPFKAIEMSELLEIHRELETTKLFLKRELFSCFLSTKKFKVIIFFQNCMYTLFLKLNEPVRRVPSHRSLMTHFTKIFPLLISSLSTNGKTVYFQGTSRIFFSVS